jgi:hypothetical protein
MIVGVCQAPKDALAARIVLVFVKLYKSRLTVARMPRNRTT